MEVLGKLLIFLSFFLVAPVLLGRGRLKDYLERKETSVVGFLAVWLGLVGLLALVYFILHQWLLIDLNPVAVGRAITGRDNPDDIRSNQMVGQVVGVACLAIVLAVSRLLRDVVDDYVVIPIIERAEKDDAYRHKLAGRGVWCFVVGSLLDLAATLMK